MCKQNLVKLQKKKRGFLSKIRLQSMTGLIILLLTFVFPTSVNGESLFYQILETSLQNTQVFLSGYMPENATVNCLNLGHGLYDITILDANQIPYQPAKGAIDVSVCTAGRCRVAHWEENHWRPLETNWNGNAQHFSASHFSLYAITMDETDTLISPDEIYLSVSAAEQVPILYEYAGKQYAPDELMEVLHCQLPSTISSGYLPDQIPLLAESLSESELNRETYLSEGEWGFRVESTNGRRAEICQAFQWRSETFYTNLDLPNDTYMAQNEYAEAERTLISENINERQAKLSRGESIVVVIPSLSSTAAQTESEAAATAKLLSSRLSSQNEIGLCVKDAQSREPVNGGFVLKDAEGMEIWSGAPASSHSIPSGLLTAIGGPYQLIQISAEDTYSLPGFPWTISVDADGYLSVTTITQQGTGLAESPGIIQTDDGLEILNEKAPLLFLHIQDEQDTIESVQLNAGDCDTGYHGIPTRSGYIFHGWSINSQTIDTLLELNLNLMPGAENHLYAVWIEKLTVVYKTYVFGDYQHAETMENSEQVPKPLLPLDTDLLNGNMLSQYLDTSMLSSNLEIAFTALETDPYLKVVKIVKTADPDTSVIYWKAEDSAGTVKRVGLNDTLVFYLYPRIVKIPIHVYEITPDGQYILRDQEWRKEGFETITLNNSVNVSLPAAQNVLADTVRSEVSMLEIDYGYEDAEQTFSPYIINTGELLTYTSQGICLGGEPTDATEDLVIGYIFYPTVRQLQVRVLEQLMDGNREERSSWQISSALSVSTSFMICNNNTGRQILMETLLLPEYMDRMTICEVYYALSSEELSIVEVKNLLNTSNGIQVNEDDLYLSENDILYVVIFENPRSWPVHLIERTAEGYEDRDEDWSVQPILVPDKYTDLRNFDPRYEPDERYVLASVRRCDSIQNLGKSNKFKELSSVMNTVNGVSVLVSGTSNYVLLRDPQQLYFLYYLKERPISVRYASVHQGMLTHIQDNMLDLSDDGNAVSSFLCGNDEYAQPDLKNPAWAVLGPDGAPVYHPFFRFAVGPDEASVVSSLTISENLPWLMNTFANFKIKPTMSGKEKSFGLDQVFYVIYDDSLDSAPSYLHVSNHTDNEEPYTFKLCVQNGEYSSPVLTEGEYSGTYLSSSDSEYVITLSKGQEITLYIPGGAGLEYSVRLMNHEGVELTGALEDYELELESGSAPLQGTLLQGPSYYWESSSDHVFKDVSAEDGNLVDISLKTLSISIPAPTGRIEWTGCLIFLFLLCLLFRILWRITFRYGR